MKKELADLRNNGEGLIYTTEKSIEEYVTLLSEKDREEIKADVANLKAILPGNDVGKIKEAIQVEKRNAEARKYLEELRKLTPVWTIYEERRQAQGVEGESAPR